MQEHRRHMGEHGVILNSRKLVCFDIARRYG